MRPETLALAADLAIRLFEAKHLDLVARIDHDPITLEASLLMVSSAYVDVVIARA